MKTLALEMGDSWEGLEAVGGLGEFPKAKSPDEERRIATLVKYGWETRPKYPEFIDDRKEIADDEESDTSDFEEYDEDEEDGEDGE